MIKIKANFKLKSQQFYTEKRPTFYTQKEKKNLSHMVAINNHSNLNPIA